MKDKKDLEHGRAALDRTKNFNSMHGESPSRRDFLMGAAVAVSSLAASVKSSAQQRPEGKKSTAAKGFPKGFLWGAATAGHQVEGNNINADLWVLENVKPTIFREPSGDACDHYHRYADDIKMLAELGLNTYRFSIEWSRIEPEQGMFSTAELDHYRRMLAACHENKVTPFISFNHFTSPRWFAALGGWEHKDAGDLFVRYCERTAKHLGDLTGGAVTFNEPNLPALLNWWKAAIPPQAADAMLKQGAKAVGSESFGSFVFAQPEKVVDPMIAAHHRARTAIKSGPGKYPVGVALAIQDEQAVGADSRRDEKRASVYGKWLEAASKDDFVGVQTYTRSRVGKEGNLPVEEGKEVTLMGWEFYPEALENTIRYASEKARVPVIVTENGIATNDDTRRVEYIKRALAGVQNCLNGGIDVKGYIHWTFLDNFEWFFGYRPTFGLVAVDRQTQKRTIKPSAKFLGQIARRNKL